MELFNREDLAALLANRQTPCVSLFMPTTRGPKHEDNTRWKNLVRQAEEELIEAGSRTSEAKDLMRPARELLEDAAFWLNVSHGLAGFCAPELFRTYRLPMTFDEQVTVAEGFHVKPLIPLLTGDGRYYVLAMSQKLVRLLQGTRHTIHEVALAGIPSSYDDAVHDDWVPETRTFHTHPASGGRADAREAVFHGQGAGIDSPKEGLPEFCHKLNKGLTRRLHNEQAPLVLAAAEPLFSIYRQSNTYPHLLAEGIEGHPDQLTARELHDRAWPLVEPHFRQTRERVVAQYHQLAGTGRTASDLAQIVPAAHQGQIQYLFVSLDQEQWGHFDSAQQHVEIHEQQEPGDEDLLNVAALQVLSHKGIVYAVEPGELPNGNPAEAIFWLPLGERTSKRIIGSVS